MAKRPLSAPRPRAALTIEPDRQPRHILAQAERCFRLARTLTSRVDAERLKALGQSYLEEARRLAVTNEESDE